MLKSNARWVQGYLTDVDDGRGHKIQMDLPPHQNGEDLAATALEYMVMGYAGCTVTMYKLIADKMRLNIDSIDISVEAEKLGYGGLAYISELLGCNVDTIRRGIADVHDLPQDEAEGRVRKKGGSKKS